MFVFLFGEKVKPKKILRFYFGADSLERAFDNLILTKAFDFGADTLETAERMCAVIGEKMRLERLWSYLDGILSVFSEDDRLSLLKYATKAAPFDDDENRAIKRAVIKFTRHARRLSEFSDDIAVLKKYYCLIKCGSASPKLKA